MSDAPASGAAMDRRFFLAAAPVDGRAQLVPEDTEHALRVLRLRAGDTLVGLDGAGSAWPLEVANAEKRTLELTVRGEPEVAPPPGAAGSGIPWIEVCLPLPKPARQTEAVDRLTQLGAASLRFLETERASEAARHASEARMKKLRRTVREACKQSRRLWELALEAPAPLESVLRAPGENRRVLLEPEGTSTLADWARKEAEASRFQVFLGPEGGFSPRERELLREHAMSETRLTPTILRIETAAELAVGTLMQALARKSD